MVELKKCLINLVGTSPMVVSEMVDFFKNDYQRDLRDVIFIATKDERVVSGAYFAGSAIKSRFPDIRTHYEFLSSADIVEDKDIVNFLDSIGSIVKNERDKYDVDKVYANISGGRKVESVVLSNFSQLLGIDEVWIVINTQISNYNIEYEKILNEISNFREGENIQYYEENKNKFDPIFFPDRKNLSFFQIPSIRYSIDDLKLLKTLLRGKDLENLNVPDYKLDAFISSRLIENNKKRSIPTEIGEVIFKYI
jgi:CRISPR-associated protein Csx14